MKYRDLIKLLKENGWYEVRSGKHKIFRHNEKKGQLTIPFHGSKEVKKGLLQKILRTAGIKTDKR